MAAKQGEPDPESNQALRVVLERAKTYNVPRTIIDRAVEKQKAVQKKIMTSFVMKDSPNGAMVIVDTLTNNVNRTAADVRAAFSKNSGNMGVNGSVAYMFDATAVIGLEGKTSDEVLEILMEADVDARDILEEEDSVIVYAEPDQFHAVQSALKGAGVEEFTVAELTMLAQSDVTLPEDAQAQFEKMVDALEDLEDVQQVYHNVDLGE